MPASTFTPDAGVRPGGGYLQSLATSPTYLPYLHTYHKINIARDPWMKLIKREFGW